MYELGAKSLAELNGVRADLVGVVKKAIHLTTQDFGVHDGLRTLEEQTAYVKAGVSKTMNSMHRVQPDGFGHAVDLVPYINGKPRWEWPPIFDIARAVRQVAIEEGVPLTWGAIWDRPLNSLSANLEAEVEAYKARRRKLGKSWFGDGPHYELRQA